jgi:anion-transporting  ArsA/GET3 family ATPase
MMLDVKNTWDDVVRRHAPNREAAQRIMDNRFYRKVTEGISGSQEYSAMLRLLDVVEDGRYDLVVVDTPPARNALEFLEAPRRLGGVLQKGVLRWLVSPSFSPSVAGRHIFGKQGAALFQIFERFVGADVLGGLSEFLTAFSGLFDTLRSRAERVEEILLQPTTAFVLVTQPSPLALRDAAAFHGQLMESGLPFGGFVINRVHWGSPVSPSTEPPRGPGAFPWLPPAEVDREAYEGMVKRVWDLHLDWTRWAEHDRDIIDGMRRRFGDSVPYQEVPDLQVDLTDLRALNLLEPYLT